MSDATCWKTVPLRRGQETNNCPLEDACCEHHQITQRGKTWREEGPQRQRGAPRGWREPQPPKPRELPGGSGKTKNCTNQTELARTWTSEKEPVQLVEMPPIPLTETGPQGIKRECKTRHSQNKGRGPKKQLDIQNSGHTNIQGPQYSTRHKCKTKK